MPLRRTVYLLLVVVVLGCAPVAETESGGGKSIHDLVARAPMEEGAAKQSRPTGKAAQQKSDSSQELFVGWPKPQVALIITGNQHGYLEPCGCTGLANQKGGLARRHSLIKQLSEKWNVLPIDAGNQVRRYGRQAELQFQMTAEALKMMGYRAIGLGSDDLQLSPSGLLSPIASDDNAGPFTSANASVVDPELLPKAVVVEMGGRRIGIVQVLGDEFRKKVSGEDLVLETADKALGQALAVIDKAKCDFRVLLAFAYPEEAEALAKKHKVFDLVVASGGPAEPTLKPEPIAGTKAHLVHTGVKGMQAVVIGLYDTKTPPRYERVALDATFPDSKEMLELMASYQDQLKELGFEGLGLKAQPHSSGRAFVGTATCGECHTQAMEVWEKTPHAHATLSLSDPKERSEIPRHYDPECLSCHVTGWDPHKFFPFKSGYLSAEKSPAMLHNGCENCHGPGSEHVAAENNVGGKFDAAAVNKLRGEMRLPLAGKAAERKCMECHDIDNSPDFHSPGAFEKYWKQVEHKGND